MQLDVEGFCGRHCNDEASLCLKQVKLHLRLILKFRLDFVGGWGGEPVCRHPHIPEDGISESQFYKNGNG